MKDATQILKEARELITLPEHWTQGAFARHKNGRVIGSLEENAYSFCAIGACDRALGAPISDDTPLELEVQRRLNQAALALASEVPPLSGFALDNIQRLNDEGTHSLILKAFDLAISSS